MFWLSLFWASVPFGPSPSAAHIHSQCICVARPEVAQVGHWLKWQIYKETRCYSTCKLPSLVHLLSVIKPIFCFPSIWFQHWSLTYFQTQKGIKVGLFIGLLQFPARMSEKSQKENSAGVWGQGGIFWKRLTLLNKLILQKRLLRHNDVREVLVYIVSYWRVWVRTQESWLSESKLLPWEALLLSSLKY